MVAFPRKRALNKSKGPPPATAAPQPEPSIPRRSHFRIETGVLPVAPAKDGRPHTCTFASEVMNLWGQVDDTLPLEPSLASAGPLTNPAAPVRASGPYEVPEWGTKSRAESAISGMTPDPPPNSAATSLDMSLSRQMSPISRQIVTNNRPYPIPVPAAARTPRARNRHNGDHVSASADSEFTPVSRNTKAPGHIGHSGHPSNSTQPRTSSELPACSTFSQITESLPHDAVIVHTATDVKTPRPSGHEDRYPAKESNPGRVEETPLREDSLCPKTNSLAASHVARIDSATSVLDSPDDYAGSKPSGLCAASTGDGTSILSCESSATAESLPRPSEVRRPEDLASPTALPGVQALSRPTSRGGLGSGTSSHVQKLRQSISQTKLGRKLQLRKASLSEPSSVSGVSHGHGTETTPNGDGGKRPPFALNLSVVQEPTGSSAPDSPSSGTEGTRTGVRTPVVQGSAREDSSSSAVNGLKRLIGWFSRWK